MGPVKKMRFNVKEQHITNTNNHNKNNNNNNNNHNHLFEGAKEDMNEALKLWGLFVIKTGIFCSWN